MTLRMRLPVWPFHAPLRTRLLKSVILSSTAWTCGHHILTVYDDGGSARGAQSDMQHRSLFRDVDLLAAEHGIDSRLQTGFFGKLNQKLESLVRDSILRIIQIDAHSL